MSGEVEINPILGPKEISVEVVSRLNELFEQGLYLQAYEIAKEYGPFQAWRGPDACVIAARLAHHLGSAALCARITARAAKRYPDHATVQYYHAYSILEWRGPLPAWNHLKKLGDMPWATPDQRADLFALRAQIAGSLRDFQTAESYLLKAEALHPGDPWLQVQRCYLFEFQDRYEESLAAAKEAAKLHPYPYYRPATLMQAHALQLLNRDHEALELLREASRRLESSAIEVQLFALQVELKYYDEALQTLERYERLSPLLSKGAGDWFKMQRCRMLHLGGRFDEALAFARQLDDSFHKNFVVKLSAEPRITRRVALPVGFVRQNYRTCAPATLAALGRFWKSPTDHLQLVAEICYDGTPAHRQREWAENNGWLVREFRLTWESGTALLDAGIPFAVTTVETNNAHLQAIVGYDYARGTFEVRDPYNPYLREFEAETFLKHYASSGPRCFVMVPKNEAGRLMGIVLPDAELYDLSHALDLALTQYDREAAATCLQKMVELQENHLLTWTARRQLAGYDGNLKENERCVDALLVMFPKDGNLQLSKIAFLRSGPRDVLLEQLQKLCRQKEADPIFKQQLAMELLHDARKEREAERLVKCSLGSRPHDATSMLVLADLRWQQRNLEDAYELYRFAASIEEKGEGATRALFAASRHLRKHHEVMAYLRDRFARFGRYSHLSLTTLFWSEVEVSEVAQAFKHLSQALEWRPQDAVLHCFAADIFARFGNYDEAKKHLEYARGRTRRQEWLRAAAQVATMEGNQAEALQLWREVLVLEPMSRDAHEALLQLISHTEGVQAVKAHVLQLHAQFPHNLDLQQLASNWLRGEDIHEAITVLEKTIQVIPDNAWAHRELADLLAETNAYERAMQQAEMALQLEPNVAFGYCVRGYIHARRGLTKESVADYQQALHLSVDNDFAQRSLLESCHDLEEKKQALQYIQDELLRQVVFGPGILLFRELAFPILDAAALKSFLVKAHQERPDLWQSWTALIQQLVARGEVHEADRLAAEAVSRFPLSPRLWVEFAQVKRMQEVLAAEIECLETAVRLSPAWNQAARQLAKAYERAGDFWKARRVIESALVHQPMDEFLHESLAQYLWKTGDRDEALARLQKALEINPGLIWSWDQLPIWAKERGRPGLALETARKLVEKRPGEMRSWIFLAQQLQGEEALTERLAAVDKALGLSPTSIWAHETKISVLMQAGRHEEALKACNPPEFKGKQPRELAYLEARAERALGNFNRSVTLLDNLLAKHPDYLDGWFLRIDWHWEADEIERAAQAAENICRLQPFAAVPWGYKGAWERKRGNREAAIHCFRRGYELSKNYDYAGFALFDLLMECGHTDEAGEVLHSLRKHTPGLDVLWRDIWLALARRETERAYDILGKLLQSEGVEYSQIELGIKVLANNGKREKASEILERVLFSGAAQPAVAAFWIREKLQKWDWDAVYKLDTGNVTTSLKVAALHEWVHILLEHAQSQNSDFFGCLLDYFRLRKCLKHFTLELKGDNTLWAQVSAIYINLKRNRQGLKWVADWQQRKGLEIWMLSNVSVLAERSGDDLQAAEAYEAGAELPGYDALSARVFSRAAIEKGLLGDAVATGKLLARVKHEELDDLQRIYWNLANLLFRACSMPGHVISAGEREWLKELIARKKQRPHDLRLAKRIARTLSVHEGNKRLSLWVWWHAHQNTVISILVVLLGLFYIFKSQ